MSNAIEGVSLPPSLVGRVRLMLQNLADAPDIERVRDWHCQYAGVLVALECLQRVNPAGLNRLAAHGDRLVWARCETLKRKEALARLREVSE